MARPDIKKVPEWYHGYINLVKGNNFLPEMKLQTGEAIRFLRKIPATKRNYRYARGKWTVQDLLQHMIDAERIFGYRALCFSRKDRNPLPAFDENEYAVNAKASRRDWNSMVNEFKLIRLSNEEMFSAFNPIQLRAAGIANNKSFSVNDIGFIMVGHVSHHIAIIRERYL